MQKTPLFSFFHIRVCRFFILVFILALLIASETGNTTAADNLIGTWYLEGMCGKSGCLKPYESGVISIMEVNPDGSIVFTGNVEGTSSNRFQLSNFNGNAFVTIPEVTGKQYPVATDNTGRISIQMDNYNYIYTRIKPVIPGASPNKTSAAEIDYAGSWRAVSVISGYIGNDGQRVPVVISAANAGLDDQINIKNGAIDIKIIGNIFEEIPYVVRDGCIYASLGYPGMAESIGIVLSVKEDGYLVETINPNKETELNIVFERVF